MINRLYILLMCIVLIGCASEPVKRPDIEGIGATSGVAKDHVSKTRANVEKASTALSEAQKKADTLKGEVPDPLKPKVDGLGRDLKKAQEELATAKAEALSAETKLLEVDARVRILDEEVSIVYAELKKARADLATAQEETDKERAEKNRQRAFAWKWRVYFWGLIAAVVGFFVARQYFPFLKLL